MATVHFLYRSVRPYANLEVRLQHTQRTAEKVTNYIWSAKTKIEVSKEYWETQHKSNSRDIDIKNKQKEIADLCAPIDRHIIECFNKTSLETISKDWLQIQVDDYYNPAKEIEALPTELIKYIDFYISKKTEISVNTIKKIRVIQQLVKRYQATLREAIYINDVNENFRDNFEAYCKANSYAPNTIATAFKFIKAVCNNAGYNGIQTSPQLKGVSKPFKKNDVIFLSFEELEKIENISKEKLTTSLENARDWLIISCYTGQRLSDFMRFNKEMIKGGNLSFVQQKTGNEMTIAVHPKVTEILKKRNGNFPDAMADQKYNEYIKTVCEFAGLTQLIKGSKKTETAPKSKIYRKETKEFRKCDLVTSHIGRRSYATNFYEILPIYLVMNNTGHKTETQLLTYLGKGSEDKANETHKYYLGEKKKRTVND